MRPALSTFLVGVAIMAVVALLLVQWPKPRLSTVSSGGHGGIPSSYTCLYPDGVRDLYCVPRGPTVPALPIDGRR